jgi:putative hemolysin
VLVVLNGVFAAAEIALVSVRRTRLRELAETGNRAAKVAANLRARPERLLATVQVGITVLGATAAAYGGDSLAEPLTEMLGAAGAGRYAHDIALVIIVAGVSYLSLVLGELVPKSLGLRYSEGVALSVARPLAALAWLARPLVWLLTVSSNLILRVFGDSTSFSESRHSPEELQQLVEESARAGALDPRVADIATRAFDFTEATVDEVMVPSLHIVAVKRSAALDELRRVLLESKHSRLPVYEGHLDNVVGYIIAKDVLQLTGEPARTVDDILRKPYFVPTSARAVDVLKELQRRQMHMAIVLFEDSTVAGLVTVEDLVEEVVGEIFSEHDKPPQLVSPQSDGSYIVLGTTSIRDANRALPFELPPGEEYATVAGLCIHLAGEIPQRGEALFTPDGARIEITDASPRRVRTVRIWAPQEARSEDGQSETVGDQPM